MPNGAHKEDSSIGWIDHSHCPWLSRLSRRVLRNSVTIVTALGIEHAHIQQAAETAAAPSGEDTSSLLIRAEGHL